MLIAPFHHSWNHHFSKTWCHAKVTDPTIAFRTKYYKLQGIIYVTKKQYPLKHKYIFKITGTVKIDYTFTMTNSLSNVFLSILVPQLNVLSFFARKLLYTSSHNQFIVLKRDCALSTNKNNYPPGKQS